MSEALENEVLLQNFFELEPIFGDNHDVEIQADYWFDVRVDALAADDTKARLVGCQYRKKRVQHVGMIGRDDLPVLSRAHGRTMLIQSRTHPIHS